jgi:predicted aldo/keto reductase-like oxidoreductase
MLNKKTRLNRREFLSSGVLGISTVGFRRLSKKPFWIKGNEGSSQATGEDIIHRKLGKTDIRLPVVNMGVMNAFNPALVKRSYEFGVRYFDTAAYYQRGKNEEMVGSAIKELNVRNKVILGTKAYIPEEQRGMSSNKKKEFFLKSAEDSLKRLMTDYIDIFYVHSVSDPSYLNDSGILEALQQLKRHGKIRQIGFTTHANMAECIQDAINHEIYDVILTAFNYAMGDDVELKQTMTKAAEKGIGLVAMKTQCAQYWYRDYVPSEKQQFYKGKILHTAVLKWALHHDFITTAIPGYTTFQQMEEDFSVAYDLSFSSEERKFLEDRGVKKSLAYCLQCGSCQPTCPKNVDIPNLMRTHMYAKCYGNFYQAKDTIEEIPKAKNLHACCSCEACTARCVNHIDIAHRIDDLKAIWS